MPGALALPSSSACVTQPGKVGPHAGGFPAATTWDETAIDEAWTSGTTLPPEVAAMYPVPPLEPEGDTGINVLVDLAHQCNFHMMWTFPANLLKAGFRPCGSQACVHTVLRKGGHSRARINYKPVVPGGELRNFPFAWIPNPEFNVIVTFQGTGAPQKYLPQEIDAMVEFVGQGGGLVIIGAKSPSDEYAREWSLNALAGRFGGTFGAKGAGGDADAHALLELSAEWEVLESRTNGPVRARRDFGKGRVVLLEDAAVISYSLRETTEEQAAATEQKLRETVTWVAAGRPPVNCEGRLPAAMSGGGGIYPEKELSLRGVVFYYAENQLEELLDSLRRDIPKVVDQLDTWIPSKPCKEPMYLVLSSGGGGGWAINAYGPRENGIISPNVKGCISIFAHELAHTMQGPPNAEGNYAGNAPCRQRGDAHAGYWQDKYGQLALDGRRGDFRNCSERMLNIEEKLGERYDLSTHFALTDRDAQRARKKRWGANMLWTKMGYIWNKMEDRYGTTWYPRWRWVQHTRWKDDPNRDLTWDEMVEDMSIAAGEDLFPFFIKLGTTLQKKRLERIEFQGEVLHLRPAPIELTPAGPLRFDPPGDYTKPITPIR
jgi:hypothetical protein